MTLTFRFAALAALLVAGAGAPVARADWTGKLQIHSEPPDPRHPADQTGTIEGKGTRMRFDVDGAEMGKMAVITDIKAHKSTMIMESHHAYSTMDMDKAQGRGPMSGMHCDSDDAAACLKKAGFTKTGTEKVNGQKADRWEHDRDDARTGEKMHETLWVPTSVKDFAFVRQTSKSASRTITIDVLEFAEGKVSDAQFEPPAGYTDMTSKMGQMMGPPGAHPPPPGAQGQMPTPPPVSK